MVVTRFAPSPTGYLHVGAARTAIFNWLFARHTGGKFLLRIEDTDIKRNAPRAINQVINDLRWLGIDWDEGPDVGGPNGPYLQSQRRDIYDKYVRKLIHQQKAYYCFDTPEELEAMRKKYGLYLRPASFPDEHDVKKAKAAGRPVTVRFAMPREDIVVNDLVRGQVKFAANQIGDFIIQKSDGLPTYNFACVVDDYLMNVTHIIRGAEHLNNTPAQQSLWKALGFGQLPKYAHMSVTISASGGKLSKRERSRQLAAAIANNPDIDLDALARAGHITRQQLTSFIQGKSTPDMSSIDAMAKYLGVHLPEINIVDFFKSGFLPEAMVNFLALLGFNPGDGREIMTVDELIDCFDLSRLTKANSLFDRKKLIAFNTEHIRQQANGKLVEHFKNYLKAIQSPLVKADDKTLSRICQLCVGARTLADIEAKSRFLFLENHQIQYDNKAVKKVLLDDGLTVLRIIYERFFACQQFNRDSIERILTQLAEERQVGLGKVAQPLRVAICGTTISLPIFDAVEMLGKEETLARIDIALKKFGPMV